MLPTRVRLLMSDGHSCYRPRRSGERRRKSVRGCIVGPDLSVLALSIVKAGEGDIPGLTDVVNPKRLGPKRATKIRKFFGLDKKDDVRLVNEGQLCLERYLTRIQKVRHPPRSCAQERGCQTIHQSSQNPETRHTTTPAAQASSYRPQETQSSGWQRRSVRVRPNSGQACTRRTREAYGDSETTSIVDANTLQSWELQGWNCMIAFKLVVERMRIMQGGFT